MCGKTDVLNDNKNHFFPHSVNSVNNCNSVLKLVFSVRGCHCDYGS